MKNYFYGTLLIALLVLTSCQPPQQGLDAEDERNPYFRKGSKLAADGNFHGAISEYEKALQSNPNVQKAYMEIGILYADKLNDPVSAAYHFQKYIDARPDAPNLSQAQTYLEKAKIDFALTLPNSSTQNAQAFAQMNKENVELKQALTLTQDSLARKEEEIAKLRTGNTSTNIIDTTPGLVSTSTTSSTENYKPAVVSHNASSPATVSTTIPVATPVEMNGTERIHVIQSGDNLWKIAKQYYPDNINGGIEKIKQANPVATASVQALKLGQKLIIP
jgi:tetratricopeptide (TPR) repeat protein